MKKILTVSILAAALIAPNATLLAASGKAPAKDKNKQLTCCEKAKAEKKECTHKCCVSAKRAGKICEKCNPGKGGLKKKQA